MQNTPFHAYYTARKLASAYENGLVAALASSNIEIYPYQIAAAEFALRSPYLKGCILCDEGSLGKTFEVLLIATQKWYEGKTRQIVILPVNLIQQWVNKIENSFSLPYILIDSMDAWQAAENENPFEQDALVITTYDFAVLQAEYIKLIKWDLVILDEADCLNKSYLESNKISSVLKDAIDGFKLLLTPTPIEMDIRDIYGLIHFIDESVLPNIDEFYKRYFRKPENYHELTDWVSKFCFRTLKSQVTEYVNFTRRIPYTISCDFTKEEQTLYANLQDYLQRPKKFAYPKMERYDLTLQHCHILSSSPKAYIVTLNRALDRLNTMQADAPLKELLQDEINVLTHIKSLAQKAGISGKAKTLVTLLKKCFSKMKQIKAPQKAIVFVDNLTTQKYLHDLLIDKGISALMYNGANSRNYEIMEQFRTEKNVQVLIATDEAAKGLDIEFCPLVINYDMLSNAVELEQRISRCHRQGQKADVLVINLIYKENYADVRYVELINKRVLQFGGIFGLSDTILGNFDVSADEVLEQLRHTQDITESFETNLMEHEQENKETVENAENILFTTFTKEIAGKVAVTPQYLEQEIDRLNGELWEVVKWYFDVCYPAKKKKEIEFQRKFNTSLFDEAAYSKVDFDIDELNKTITVQSSSGQMPTLFYYWVSGRNRPYVSQSVYGMAKDFKPRAGRITLSSVLARGIYADMECAKSGVVEVNAEIEPCTIAFYIVRVDCDEERCEFNLLAGETEAGAVLSDKQCQEILTLPVLSYTEHDNELEKQFGYFADREMDELVETEKIKQKALEREMPAQAEQIGLLKLKTAHAKGKLEHSLDDLRTKTAQLQRQAESTPVRIEKLKIEKQLKILQKELRQQEENLFLNSLRLDSELEKQIDELRDKSRIKCRADRQFLIQVKGRQG